MELRKLQLLLPLAPTVYTRIMLNLKILHFAPHPPKMGDFRTVCGGDFQQLKVP
jgi:hypothetical protein